MADRQPPTSPYDVWISPTTRFSPFVALCAVGFLGRLSYEMMRTPLTPIYAKHLGAPDQYIGLLVAAVTITGIVVKLPSLWDVGHAGGPVVFGFLLVAFGYRTSWLIMALVMAAALLVFLIGTNRAPMDQHGGAQ